MTLRRRRQFLFLSGLAIVAPLAGLAYTFAQGMEAAPSGMGVQFNWGSVILTLLGAALGVAVMWGTLNERVKQHGREIDDIWQNMKGLVPRTECQAIEGHPAAAAQTSAQAHADMVALERASAIQTEALKQLLARKD